jgi:hypothetical protein
METWLGSFPSSCANSDSNALPFVTWGGIANLEEGPNFAFQQFDPQPFGGNGHFDLIFNLVEVRDLADGLLQFLL